MYVNARSTKSFLVFIALAMSAIFIPPKRVLASDWQDIFRQAHNVSRQGVGSPEKIQQGQDSAIALAYEAIASIPQDSPNHDSALAAILVRLSDFQIIRSLYKDAIATLNRCLPLATGQPHLAILRERALHRYGLLCDEHSNTTSEAPFCASALALRDSLLSSPTSDDIARLYRLAEMYDHHARWDMSLSLFKRIIKLWEADPGSHPDIVVRALIFFAENSSKPTLSNVGKSSASQDSAVCYGRRALTIAEDYLGHDDTLVAFSATRLGDYHARLGEYDEMLELWERAWQINRTWYPPIHIEHQGSINRMAGVYEAQGRYEEALRLRRQALALRIQFQGPGHPEVAAMHRNLADVLQQIGRFDEAQRHYLEAYRIHDNAVERVQSDVAQDARLLGRLHYDRGDYVAAESRYLEAIELERTASPSNARRLASCLIDLADLYTEWNRLNESIELLTEALALQEGFLGPDHPTLTTTLSTLAQVELSNGELSLAQERIDRALDISSDAGEFATQSRAHCFAVSADIARRVDRHHDAVERMTRALGELETVYPADDHRLLPYLANMVEDYLQIGDTTNAKHHLERAWTINSRLTGSNHPYSARIFEVSAGYFERTGILARAIDHALRAFAIRRQNLINGSAVMTEPAALRAAHNMEATRNLVLSLARKTDGSDGGISHDVATVVLQSKGLVSEALIQRHRRHQLSGDTLINNLRDSIRYVQSKLSGLYTHNLLLVSDTGYSSSLEQTSHHLAQLKTRLARVVGGQSDTTRTIGGSAPDYSEIADALPEYSALVEYLQYEHDGASQYLALVVRPKYSPMIVALGAVEPINTAIAAYRHHLDRVSSVGRLPTREDMDEYQLVVHNMQDLIWTPLADLISNAEVIFISPSDQLHLVSWAGFVSDSGRFLIEDRLVRYLSSGRDLLTGGSFDGVGIGLLAVGDPDFQARASQRFASLDSIQYDHSVDRELQPPFLSYLTRSNCWRTSVANLPRLYGTRQEIETIQEAWERRFDDDAHAATGAAASEELIKQSGPGHRVIHIATHGHIPTRKCLEAGHTSSENHAQLFSKTISTLLSGLCLAGLQSVEDTASVKGEDGLLTTGEIAGMELTGTELVVLSACETAIGDIRGNEAVNGMTRAFQMAGARAVISSLWKVSDQYTLVLMQRFYEHVDEGPSYALRLAELELIDDLRGRDQPAHPYLWAGFISTGR